MRVYTYVWCNDSLEGRKCKEPTNGTIKNRLKLIVYSTSGFYVQYISHAFEYTFNDELINTACFINFH